MQMSRVLMCREHPVLEFRYFATGGYIVEVGEVLDAARLPLGMYVDGRPEPTGESASAWWRSRGVPMTRDGLGKVLAGMGVATSADLLDRSMGLSLSDQYWVRPIERDDLTWADLNFFHHDFDGQLGKALFLGNASKVDEMNTPDVTSAGDLPKRWIIADDGARQLVKAGRTGQEPDNERIATLVAQLLGIAHVEYRVGAMHGTRVSVCDEMLTDTEEIVAGGAIRHIFREGTRQEGKQIWLDACERLGVARVEAERAIDDFLLLDFLLRNTDRHYNNFGLIRDVESLAVRPAPIFDSGESLWNGMDPDAIDNADYPAKPFWLDDAGERNNAFWQLSLVRDWSRWNLDALDEVPTIARAQLETNRRLSPWLIDTICSALSERVTLVRRAARGLQW